MILIVSLLIQWSVTALGSSLTAQTCSLFSCQFLNAALLQIRPQSKG